MTWYRNRISPTDNLGLGDPRVFDTFREYLKPNNKVFSLARRVSAFNRAEAALQKSQSIVAISDGKPVPDGYPWITPVVGTGISEGRADVESIHRYIHRLLDALPDEGDGNAIPVAEFSHKLLHDRIAHGELAVIAPHADNGDAQLAEVDKDLAATCWLLSLTYLLTSAHYRGMASQAWPVPRWEDDDRVPEENAALRETKVMHLSPARKMLDQIPPGIPDPLVQWIGILRSRLDARGIPSLVEIRLLTECCWLRIQRGAGVGSPGWTDLMVRLEVENLAASRGEDPTTIGQRDGRPQPYVLGLTESAENLAAALDDLRGEAVKPTRFHAAVAELLRAQAALRAQGRNRGPHELPVPATFVMSFDTCLESSLKAIKQSFIQAVPFYLFERVAENAIPESVAIVWLGRKVTPNSTGDWFTLSGRPGPGEHGDLPFVVKILGSCDADLGLQLGETAKLRELVQLKASAALDLVPLFVIEEQVARIMGSMESYVDQLLNRRFGLPRWLTGVRGGPNARFARFWLVAGVQIGDTALRTHLVTELTASAATTAPPDNPPDRAGLVVSRRINPLDARQLLWQGFDVVTADIEGDDPGLLAELKRYNDLIAP